MAIWCNMFSWCSIDLRVGAAHLWEDATSALGPEGPTALRWTPRLDRNRGDLERTPPCSDAPPAHLAGTSALGRMLSFESYGANAPDTVANADTRSQPERRPSGKQGVSRSASSVMRAGRSPLRNTLPATIAVSWHGTESSFKPMAAKGHPSPPFTTVVVKAGSRSYPADTSAHKGGRDRASLPDG